MAKVEVRYTAVEYVVTLSEAELKAIQMCIGYSTDDRRIKAETGGDLRDIHETFASYVGTSLNGWKPL